MKKMLKTLVLSLGLLALGGMAFATTNTVWTNVEDLMNINMNYPILQKYCKYDSNLTKYQNCGSMSSLEQLLNPKIDVFVKKIEARYTDQSARIDYVSRLLIQVEKLEKKAKTTRSKFIAEYIHQNVAMAFVDNGDVCSEVDSTDDALSEMLGCNFNQNKSSCGVAGSTIGQKDNTSCCNGLGSISYIGGSKLCYDSTKGMPSCYYSSPKGQYQSSLPDLKYSNGMIVSNILQKCDDTLSKQLISIYPSVSTCQGNYGHDIYNKGFVIDKNGNRKEDTCSNSNTLRDYSCLSDGSFQGDSYTCPNSCSNGACVQTQPTQTSLGISNTPSVQSAKVGDYIVYTVDYNSQGNVKNPVISSVIPDGTCMGNILALNPNRGGLKIEYSRDNTRSRDRLDTNRHTRDFNKYIGNTYSSAHDCSVTNFRILLPNGFRQNKNVNNQFPRLTLQYRLYVKGGIPNINNQVVISADNAQYNESYSNVTVSSSSNTQGNVVVSRTDDYLHSSNGGGVTTEGQYSSRWMGNNIYNEMNFGVWNITNNTNNNISLKDLVLNINGLSNGDYLKITKAKIQISAYSEGLKYFDGALKGYGSNGAITFDNVYLKLAPNQSVNIILALRIEDGFVSSNSDYATVGFTRKDSENKIVNSTTNQEIQEQVIENYSTRRILKKQTVQQQKPDLTYSDFVLETPNPKVGDTIRIQYTDEIKNRNLIKLNGWGGNRGIIKVGQNDGSNVHNAVNINAKSIYSFSDVTYSKNITEESFQITQPGSYRFYQQADSNNVIDESNENNNYGYIDFYVSDNNTQTGANILGYIAGRQGMNNQHRYYSGTGTRYTDPDGHGTGNAGQSGRGMEWLSNTASAIKYCQKFFPETNNISVSTNEAISTRVNANSQFGSSPVNAYRVKTYSCIK